MDEEINKYTRESIRLAQEENYLDRIIDIYPAKLPPKRPLPTYIKERVQILYKQGNYRDIVLLLLNLKDYPFPIEHPYASLLRHLSEENRHKILAKNPRLLEELVSMIKGLGAEGIIEGVERPKDINRMLGHSFKSWVKRKFTTSPFKVVSNLDELSNCSHINICIYVGSDVEISEFAVNTLLSTQSVNESERYRDLFRRDILVRVRNRYIIGEARFLSTPGGSQRRDLANALQFLKDCEEVKSKTGIPLYGIAIIDGIVWFYDKYLNEIINVAKGNRFVLSALLLENLLLDFFNQSL